MERRKGPNCGFKHGPGCFSRAVKWQNASDFPGRCTGRCAGDLNQTCTYSPTQTYWCFSGRLLSSENLGFHLMLFEMWINMQKWGESSLQTVISTALPPAYERVALRYVGKGRTLSVITGERNENSRPLPYCLHWLPQHEKKAFENTADGNNQIVCF